MIPDGLEMMLIFDNKPFVNISKHNFIFSRKIISSPTVILQYLCSCGKAKVLDVFSTKKCLPLLEPELQTLTKRIVFD